jgi:hypothetical protein
MTYVGTTVCMLLIPSYHIRPILVAREVHSPKVNVSYQGLEVGRVKLWAQSHANHNHPVHAYPQEQGVLSTES